MTKIDEGILQLKIDTSSKSILEYINKLSSLQSKYYKEINEFKSNLDKKEAEVKSIVIL